MSAALLTEILFRSVLLFQKKFLLISNLKNALIIKPFLQVLKAEFEKKIDSLDI